jgi:hypothetical protein
VLQHLDRVFHLVLALGARLRQPRALHVHLRREMGLYYWKLVLLRYVCAHLRENALSLALAQAAFAHQLLQAAAGTFVLGARGGSAERGGDGCGGTAGAGGGE